MMPTYLQNIKRCVKINKCGFLYKPLQNISTLNEKEFQTIYTQDSNNIKSGGLVGASFITTLFTSNFAVPLVLSGLGFTMLLTSSFFVNEIKFNQQDQKMILKQNRRLIVLRPNEQNVLLNQLNVMYLGNNLAIININNDDVMKTYLLPLSQEENKQLIQLLQKRKKN